MEENIHDLQKPSAGKATLYYGLILGVVLIILHLILYLLNIHKETAATVITLVVTAAGIYLAARDYRNNKLNGYISYGRAVKIGFLTMVFAAIISAIYTFIFLSYISPGDILQAKIEATQEIYKLGLSPEQEEQSLKMQDFIHTPLVYAAGSILFNTILGILLSLIISIFIKKEEPQGISS